VRRRWTIVSSGGLRRRDDLQAELVVDALQMAVARRRPEAGLVHHSDRGSQYASLAFGATPRDSGIMASMGSRGGAYDNAAAERFFSTIKKELISRHMPTASSSWRADVDGHGIQEPGQSHVLRTAAAIGEGSVSVEILIA
jgi:transposase InsO family protein